MRILSHKALAFINPTNQSDIVTVHPRPQPHEVPDWVRESDTFKFGVKSNAVVEIQIVSPVPDPPASIQPEKHPQPFGLEAETTQEIVTKTKKRAA